MWLLHVVSFLMLLGESAEQAVSCIAGAASVGDCFGGGEETELRAVSLLQIGAAWHAPTSQKRQHQVGLTPSETNLNAHPHPMNNSSFLDAGHKARAMSNKSVLSGESKHVPTSNKTLASGRPMVQPQPNKTTLSMLASLMLQKTADSETPKAVAKELGEVAEDTIDIWPYPAKVGGVIVLFVIFEYLLDFVEWLRMRPAPDWKKSPVRGKSGDSEHVDPEVLGQFSVLTLNVWVRRARENLERQIHGIRRLSPDVICLQEVFHLDVLEAYKIAFPDYCVVAFGRAHNFLAWAMFALIMVGWACIFAGSVWLVERYAIGLWKIAWLVGVPVFMALYSRLIRHNEIIAFLTGNRTGLAMLLRRDAFRLGEQNCATYSREGHAADILNLFRPRGFISVLCHLDLPGEDAPLPVRFVTTHLNQPLDQALGDGRHRQVKEVCQNCIRENETIVLGCDLNATPPGTKDGSGCNTYSDVQKELLVDAWAAINPDDPGRDGLTWDQLDNPMCADLQNSLIYGSFRWRCDYIFWRFWNSDCKGSSDKARAEPVPRALDVSVRSCDLVFTGSESVSDHYGVHAVFDVRRTKHVLAPTQAVVN